MTDSDDVLDALEAYVAENPEPFATAPDLAERVDATRRHVLDELRLLEAAGRVDSRKVGRARVFWLTGPSAEPPAEPPAEQPGESDSFPLEEPEPSRDSPPAVPPAEQPAGLDELEFPGGRDRDDCLAAIEAARQYLETEGRASMRELVREVMPSHPVGYDVPELEPGDRFRGAWWRRIVKPGLETLEDVEKPPRGGSEWRYIG